MSELFKSRKFMFFILFLFLFDHFVLSCLVRRAKKNICVAMRQTSHSDCATCLFVLGKVPMLSVMKSSVSAGGKLAMLGGRVASVESGLRFAADVSGCYLPMASFQAETR